MLTNIPIKGWAIFGVICLIIAFVAIGIIAEAAETKREKRLTIIVSLVLAAICLTAIGWWYTNTESGKRAVKDQRSNFYGGISREVRVYDMEGDLIQSYSGEFDVEMHDTYVLFDDEQGKRHIVYFTTGTVIMDEQ